MLVELVPGQIWCSQMGLKIGPLKLTTRMTVVRLRNGALWVHSPVSPSPELRTELAAIGPVEYVVAPNKSHHLYFTQFIESFPEARGFIAPELDTKRPDLKKFQTLSSHHPWQPELQGYFISGLPVLNETVWFHVASGTLLVADLLFCFRPGNSRLMTLAAAFLGVKGRLAMSRTMKMMVKNKAAFMDSVMPLMSLPVQRVIVGHDSIIEESAGDKIGAAFAWLN